MMTDEEIVEKVSSFPARMVILTGGEPSLWIDKALISRLREAGVAEATSQVATGEADEYGGSPRMEPFALQAVEYLVNLPHRSPCYPQTLLPLP